jgi:hypothetical protein
MSGVIIVELDIESIEVRLVFFVHAFDKLFRHDTGGARANHDRSAVGVVCAEVKALIAACFMESHPYIGLKIFDKVSYMNGAVCIRQG